MAKIRLNLSRMPIPQKIARSQQILTALTGNTSFPTPAPALASVKTAIDDLDASFTAAHVARQTARQKTSDMTNKEDALDQIMTQLAAYVESIAGGDERLILSAGMDTRAPGVTSTEPPDQPQGFTSTAGDRDGEIDLAWDTVSGAKSYVIEKSSDPGTPTTWTHAGVSTRSNFTANGLTSGTRYSFRVAALNANGQSGWSEASTKMAP